MKMAKNRAKIHVELSSILEHKVCVGIYIGSVNVSEMVREQEAKVRSNVNCSIR
jgi:hypothetical protein